MELLRAFKRETKVESFGKQFIFRNVWFFLELKENLRRFLLKFCYKFMVLLQNICY